MTELCDILHPWLISPFFQLRDGLFPAQKYRNKGIPLSLLHVDEDGVDDLIGLSLILSKLSVSLCPAASNIRSWPLNNSGI